MQMGGGRDGDGIDAGREQFIHRLESRTIDETGYARTAFGQRIGNARELHAGQLRQNARMVAAHHTRTDNTHAQITLAARQSFGSH